MDFSKIVSAGFDDKNFIKTVMDLDIRYKSEIENLVDYRTNGFISAQTLLDRSKQCTENYDDDFAHEFNKLSFENKIIIISNIQDADRLLNFDQIEDCELLLTSARIIK